MKPYLILILIAFSVGGIITTIYGWVVSDMNYVYGGIICMVIGWVLGKALNPKKSEIKGGTTVCQTCGAIVKSEDIGKHVSTMHLK